ncbi:hypothetical protein NH26_18330 [Flammeovirga pacifica]|uniref:Tetratricopeptide repeat protein n=1 Tax=Flammeovirga pacifica TaxID=915059 RepID=A0A1S1Z4T4_FLAPC|nr:hypothetical protein NH26_18330 [Flammeovirga pacifica]
MSLLLLPFLFSFTTQDDTLKLNNGNNKLFYNQEWYHCAKTAKDLLNDNDQMVLALEWIDQSLDLDINSVNLEIKGDYYWKTGDIFSAIEQYKKALRVKSLKYCMDKDFKRIKKKLAKLNKKIE